MVTGWIDASNVSGSDSERASALRTLDGNGHLQTSEAGLLPHNVDGLANSGGVSEQMSLARDLRVNEQVDLWVGGLAEDYAGGGMVGELLRVLLIHQFSVLRDGVGFWYENQFSQQQVDYLLSTTLADIIRCNTDIDAELPDSVFQTEGSAEQDEEDVGPGISRRARNVAGDDARQVACNSGWCFLKWL